MKKHIFLAGIIALSTMLQPAQADSLLIAAKGGIQSLDFEVPQYGKGDTSLIAVIQMGYEFSSLKSMTLATELELSSSLDKGEVLGRDFNLQNSALYLSMRGRGEHYFIGKLGAVETEVDFVNESNQKDKGGAISIGMGFGKVVGLEVELSVYSYQDMGTSAMFSAGLSF
jgi:hypothetical protein